MLNPVRPELKAEAEIYISIENERKMQKETLDVENLIHCGIIRKLLSRQIDLGKCARCNLKHDLINSLYRFVGNASTAEDPKSRNISQVNIGCAFSSWHAESK